MDLQQNLEVLRTKLKEGAVGPRDVEFVTALCTKRLTPNMAQWVPKMVEKLTRPAPVQTVKSVASFARVYAMFAKAAEKLANPKVVLKLADGTNLKLYRAGERSRVPGVVNVVEASKDVNYEDRTWFGRVYEDGRWEGGRGTPEQRAAVESMLTRFAAEPEKVAAEYGKLTGQCCFCCRPLSDERSTEVGYGPVCASRFGLDWGGKPQRRVRVLRQMPEGV